MQAPPPSPRIPSPQILQTEEQESVAQEPVAQPVAPVPEKPKRVRKATAKAKAKAEPPAPPRTLLVRARGGERLRGSSTFLGLARVFLGGFGRGDDGGAGGSDFAFAFTVAFLTRFGFSGTGATG